MTLHVKILAADEAGCGHARCIYPVQALLDTNEDVKITMVFDLLNEESLELHTVGPLGNQRIVKVTHPGCDVLVMQRPAHRQLAESIPFIQAHGVAVVCEYDDDFDSVDKRNPAYNAYSSVRSPDMNAGWAKVAAQLADLVTVTTSALARRYGNHGRVTTIPNYVPQAHIGVKPLPGWERDWVQLGYAGNPAVHPGDLELTGPAVPRLLRELSDVGFRGVGGTGIPDCLSFDPSEFVGRTEIVKGVAIGDYPRALASFDVGIVPLRDTTFNRAKSWLKGLEYAAAGVPFVASPTEQYRSLEKLGIGRCVNTTAFAPDAWTETLRPLLVDEGLRSLLAEEGQLVVKELTYEKNAWKWLQAWHDALTLRRAH